MYFVHLAACVAKTLKTMDVIPMFVKLLAPEGLFIVADIVQKCTHKTHDKYHMPCLEKTFVVMDHFTCHCMTI